MKYKFRDYTYGQLKDHILMPDFQRSLVWKDEQKKKFIKTALDGNPFGSLLLYNHVKSGKYIVIDGLQRFTTLRNYENDPFNYIEIDEESFPEISKIRQLISEDYPNDSEENITENILLAMKKVIKKSSELIISIFVDQVTNEISKTYTLIESTRVKEEVARTVQKLAYSLIKYIQIDTLNVPVIIYEGSEAELPEIFERLNQGGTKLSKYEVFASSWKDTVLSGVESDITQRVERRYQAIMENTDLDIEGYTEGSIIADGKVSLYEYAFALGKILKDNNKILTAVKRSRADDTVDSLGFSTLITFMGEHLKYMARLKKYINQDISPANLTRFKRILLIVYKEVEDILKPYIGPYNKFIEAQVLSIVYTWFKINYDFDVKTLTATRKHNNEIYVKRFKKYMPYRYLNDSIKSFWSGHGDNSLDEIVKSDLDQNRYLIPVDKESWRLSLDEWIDNQMRSPQKSFSADTKMFYAYLMHQSGFNLENKYFFQYIIPKKIVSKISGFVPISPLGNYYLLPDNHKAYRNEFLFYRLDEKHIKWEYPTQDQLQFVMDNRVNEITYKNFLEERHRYLIERFLSNLPE